LKPFVFKFWLIALVVIVVCCSAAWAVWSIANSRSSAKLRRAEDSLRHDIDLGVPLGTDPVAVSQFLRSHAISTDGYRRLNTEYQALYKGAAGVMIGSTEKIDTPIYLCRILVTFRFNDKDRLEGYDESPVCNGPF